jgi:hypothetical protein
MESLGEGRFIPAVAALRLENCIDGKGEELRLSSSRFMIKTPSLISNRNGANLNCSCRFLGFLAIVFLLFLESDVAGSREL